jgi:hypothetical protein
MHDGNGHMKYLMVYVEKDNKSISLGFTWPVINAGERFSFYTHDWKLKIGVLDGTNRPSWYEAAVVYKCIN